MILTFSSHAQYTYVPDNNFVQALINLGYDNAIDNYVLTSNINSITALSVQGQNISSLEGIEDFSSLQNLNCNGNQLSVLNLNLNENIKYIQCKNNPPLVAIDLRINNYTNLSTLNVINNPSLSCIAVNNIYWFSNNFATISNLFSSSCTAFISGCTDSTAFNYDSIAVVDDKLLLYFRMY